MSTQKLLKCPARLLLITLVAATQINVANGPVGRLAALAPLSGQHQAAPAKSRTRQEPFVQGIERWGLNE